MFSSKGRIKIITMKKNSNSIKAEQQDTTTEINNNNIIIMNEKKKFKSDNSETEVEMVSIQISQLARSKIATTSTSKNNNDTSIAASHHSQQDSGVDFPMSVSELEELTRTPHVYSSVGEHMKRELQVAMIDGAILMSS